MVSIPFFWFVPPFTAPSPRYGSREPITDNVNNRMLVVVRIERDLRREALAEAVAVKVACGAIFDHIILHTEL
jgi:hypothetical protein